MTKTCGVRGPTAVDGEGTQQQLKIKTIAKGGIKRISQKQKTDLG
jgi:hypothetical protein